MDHAAAAGWVEANIGRLMTDFGLTHWRVVVVYERIDASPARIARDHHATGECSVNAPYERAAIRIDPEAIEDVEELAETVRHELLHVVLGPFYLYRKWACSLVKAGSAADAQEDAVWDDACERAVRNLERFWHGMTRRAEEAAAVPLKRGFSKKTQEANFKELKKAHPEMPNKQRVAIVLSSAQKSADKAGKPGKGPGKPKARRKGKSK